MSDKKHEKWYEQPESLDPIEGNEQDALFRELEKSGEPIVGNESVVVTSEGVLGDEPEVDKLNETASNNPINKKATSNSKGGTKKAIKFTLVALSVALVVGGIYAGLKYKNTSKNQIEEISLAELVSDNKQEIARLETRFIEVIEGTIQPLQKSLNKIIERSDNLAVNLTELKSDLGSLKKVVTALGESERFNAQLVEIIERESGQHKNKIAALKSNVSELRTLIKNTPLLDVLGQKSKSNEPERVKNISGFKLFNIDVWGSEQIAVFTKGSKTIRRKVGELIEGNYIESVDLAKGEVKLTQGSEKYIVSVR